MFKIKCFMVSMLNRAIVKNICKLLGCKIIPTYNSIINNLNTVVLIKEDGTEVFNPKIDKLNVKFCSAGNCLEIHEPFNIKSKVNIIFAKNGSKVKFKKGCAMDKLTLLMGTNDYIEFGEKTTCSDVFVSLCKCSNNKMIKIGKGCMFSSEVQIRCSDSHTIYDKDTKEVLNPDKDVVIGDRVWIGTRAVVLKGAKIPSGCVVGACSLVNKEFEKENCILAGTPARVIKEDIRWDRRSPSDWEEFISKASNKENQ